MLKPAHNNGWIRSFNVVKDGNARVEITCLQYAYDTFIFCDAEESQLKILRVILIINWRKGHMIPINEVNRTQQLAESLGGEIGQLPTVYLGCLWEPKENPKRYGMRWWRDVKEDCLDGKHSICQVVEDWF